MNCHNDFTLSEGLLETLAENGCDALPDVLRLLLNAAMLIERQKHLGAGPYERTSERVGHANGFKDKTIQTRMGAVPLSVPQVREGGFYPSALEKGQRSERALKLALAEMYVQGVSTRKVAAITEKLCGFDISSAQVSRLAAEMDAALEAWRNRPLGEFPYVSLDARYESVRVDGRMRDAAVLIALGVDKSGKRQILGVSVSLSEAEVHWRDFLKGLVARGLSGVRSDCQRRAPRTFRRPKSSVRQCVLAALPVPLAAKRARLCHAAGTKGAACRVAAGHFQCGQPARSGNAAGEIGKRPPQEQSVPFGLA